MIVTEIFKSKTDGKKLIRTFSDKNFQIMQCETGHIYNEAVDNEHSEFKYSETDSYVVIAEEN